MGRDPDDTDELRAWFRRRLDGLAAGAVFDRDRFTARTLPAARVERPARRSWLAALAAMAVMGAAAAALLYLGGPAGAPAQAGPAGAAGPAIRPPAGLPLALVRPGATRLTVTETAGGSRHTVRVDNSERIEALVAVLARGVRVRPGTYHCPAAMAPVHDVLRLRYGAAGFPRTVTVNWEDQGCSWFTVGAGTAPVPLTPGVAGQAPVYWAPAALSAAVQQAVSGSSAP